MTLARRLLLSLAPLALVTGLSATTAPRPTAPEADPEDVASIDAILAATYDVISGPAGEARDWDRFRSLFHADGGRLSAVGMDREGKPRLLLMTPDEYIERNAPWFDANGFYEQEVARRVERFGHIAHVFSTYAAVREPGAEPFMRGINSIQLVWDGERWSVLSILWDPEREGQPLPDHYLASPTEAGTAR